MVVCAVSVVVVLCVLWLQGLCDGNMRAKRLLDLRDTTTNRSIMNTAYHALLRQYAAQHATRE